MNGYQRGLQVVSNGMKMVIVVCAVLGCVLILMFGIALLSDKVRGGPKGPDFGTDPPIPGPTWEITYRGMSQDVWSEVHKGAEFVREQQSGVDLVAGVAEKYKGDWTFIAAPLSIWTFQAPIRTDGATDSQQECEDATDELCEDAGHGGSSGSELTATAQGGCTCSADCDENGAVAFVISGNPCGG